MKFFKKTKLIGIITAIASIAVGVFLILFPAVSINAICYVLGTAAIIFGVVKTIGYFQQGFTRFVFQFDLGLGIFLIVLGILLVTATEKIATIIPIIVGVFLIIEGAMHLETYIDAKKCGVKYRTLMLVFAVITCVSGLLLIINPFKGANALMILLGISLVIDGVENLLTVLCFSNFFKKVKSNERVIKLDDETEIHF